MTPAEFPPVQCPSCGCTEEIPCYPGEGWTDEGVCERCARSSPSDAPPYRSTIVPRHVA